MMEDGCLEYPGTCTVTNHPLDSIMLPWLTIPHNPMGGEKSMNGPSWAETAKIPIQTLRTLPCMLEHGS